MVTVFDIVTSPTFDKFQIIAGEKGIQNPVSGTGIFDWESKDDIARTFRKGEFVITTLAIARDDFEYANDCIKTLIQHGVAAICIKEVFFRNLSEETILKSNILGVPIFFFSDTFVDDIVFEVRNLLASDQGALYNHIVPVIHDALWSWYHTGSVNPENKELLESKLHAYLHDYFQCFVLFPKAGAPSHPIPRHGRPTSDQRFLLIPYGTGLIVLLSYPNETPFTQENLIRFFDSIKLNSGDFWIGGSTPHRGIRQLVPGMLESFQACTCTILKNQDDATSNAETQIEIFSPAHLEYLMISNCWSASCRLFFSRIDQRLSKYDKEHGADLLGTLMAYIHANGDLITASKMLFQHANTVRYRITKIKQLLTMDSPNSYMELFAFVKLMEIYRIFDETFGLAPDSDSGVASSGPSH